ncbi:MAG TPA: hypothetical protein DDX39_12560 [Bacteroidales bacterium]|nr:MAG: hypothetical protein A2W98_05435 [Bacteroidetes bacterium GWF2_33_38]OFY92023.1 MAG: hypothetical protein A2236_10195 [Bacteroidetes bacterium RIFOXYA2_FULL_33_7]HBF89464.1 hypothetical protein [Bacteroidales bacterium]
MKLFSYISLAALAVTLFACQEGAKNTNESGEIDSTATESTSLNPNQRYGVKSGIVYYEPMNIMGIQTTQILYFDDYGAKEARIDEVEGEMMGIKTKKRTVNIMDGTWSYTFDTENITNGKSDLEKKVSKMDLSLNPFAQMDLSKMTEEIKKNFDYKEEGTEEVLGFTGKKYSLKLGQDAPQRIYGVAYKNVPLKVDMGQIKMIASKFEENASIPSSVFELPADYEVVEVKPMSEMTME